MRRIQKVRGESITIHLRHTTAVLMGIHGVTVLTFMYMCDENGTVLCTFVCVEMCVCSPTLTLNTQFVFVDCLFH